jgi:hypothetical protein
MIVKKMRYAIPRLTGVYPKLVKGQETLVKRQMIVVDITLEKKIQLLIVTGAPNVLQKKNVNMIQKKN